MAVKPYLNSEGEQVPSVTQVLDNLGWKTRGISWWNWNEGHEGRDYMQTLDIAAAAGTLAHRMVELDLKGYDKEAMLAEIFKLAPAEDILSKATTAYNAWLKWKDLVRFELIASELPLVSELHQFGGRLDIAVIADKRCIIDLKTSKDVYADQKVQLAAYHNLYNENRPAEPVEDDYILRLGKEDGSFSHHYYPDLTPHWEMFKYLLEIHRLKKVIGK